MTSARTGPEPTDAGPASVWPGNADPPARSTAAGGRRGRLRPRAWRHWTLRSRLGVPLVTLVAVALLVANAAGLILLRSYLVAKVDDQLAAMAMRFQRPPYAPGTPVPTPLRSRFFGPNPNLVVHVYDRAGNLIEEDESPVESAPPRLETFEKLRERVASGPYTVEAMDGDSTWRILVVAHANGGVVVLGASLAEATATLESMLAIDAAVVTVVLALLGMLATGIIRIGLAPLTRMETIAGQITAGDLSHRVPDADPHTEPGRLGLALNTMLARIESEVAARTASEQRLRQFVADASHELRTPLTSIRGFAELYRRGGAPPGPVLDEVMGRIESEAARMGLLVEDLLLLARLDLQRPLDRRPVDLLAIAADTIRDAHARAPERSVALSPLHETLEPVTVLGDEHRLRQVATNLVANALQHTPPQAQITVRVGKLHPAEAAALAAGWPGDTPAGLLEVADTGPGIPAEHADRVFERLYRVDPSRTRGHGGGGSGLGLAIVAAIVQSHGGRVGLSTDRRGSVFRVVLPMAASAAAPPFGRPPTPDQRSGVDSAVQRRPSGEPYNRLSP